MVSLERMCAEVKPDVALSASLQAALVGVAQLVEREVDRAEAEAGLGGDAADAGEGDVAGASDLIERAAASGRIGDDDAGLRLAEEGGVEAARR